MLRAGQGESKMDELPQAPPNLWPDAWLIPNEVEDQYAENRLTPNVPVSVEELQELGICYWKLDAVNYKYPTKAIPWDPKDATDPMLKKLRDDRGYSYADIITVHPDHLPGFEQKLKAFFEEHIHDAEEIRYILGGQGYFDVRNLQDEWIRIFIKTGDLMTLPEGIYHRFTCDNTHMIHAMRLFKGVPVWTPFNRPCDEHESRQWYVKNFANGEKKKKENLDMFYKDAKNVPQAIIGSKPTNLPQAPANEWPEAWMIPDEVEDQYGENRLQPNVPVYVDELQEIGINYWKLDAEAYKYPIKAIPWDPKDAADPMLMKLRDDRGYSYADIITVHPDHLPGFEQKLKAFFEEHIHDAEEIRYILGGSGYFDVRNLEDKWIRIHIKAGDLMTLPEGIYHRFTCDDKRIIHAMRLFKGVPVWTPFNRPCEEHKSRQWYLKEYSGGKEYDIDDF